MNSCSFRSDGTSAGTAEWLSRVLSCSCVDSCFIPSNLYVPVPQTIPAGYEVTKVEPTDCDTNSVHFTLKDSSFTIQTDGLIVALSTVTVATGRTFSVWARDDRGLASEMEVHLVHRQLQKREFKGEGLLRRSKRRWSPPPFNILENDSGPFPKEIEKLITKVFDETTHQETDAPLPIRVIVDDLNDNAPQFASPLQFTVPEKSKAGTLVGKVNATDRDMEGTTHVKIRYTLLSGLNLFNINPRTGEITTVTNTLDREEKEKHLVTVQIQDLDGAVNGLKTTGTATITLGDINDNPPTFQKTSFTATVNENEKDKLILRIPVEDKDLKNTPNWISKFVITSGNENGNFRIETDPKTNEGLLYVSKPLNRELTETVKLQIEAHNEAELVNTNAKWNSVPVVVTVTDVDEGPEFTAPTIRFTVKENTKNGTVIGRYTATDPETKSSNGITYYKVSDPASWISVDKNTGELRVANTIDRESHHVQDGIYNITMKAVDTSLKSGTGTVIIQVEDENDNVPMPLKGDLFMCESDGEHGSVTVVADDKDQSPLSSPFTFSLPPDNDGKWSLTRLNGTAATLRPTKKHVIGNYSVSVEIKDLQGHGDTQTDPSLITVLPTEQISKDIKQEYQTGKGFGYGGGQSIVDNGIYQTGSNMFSGQFDTQQIDGQYVDYRKLAYMGTDADERYADDIIHSYGFEGVGSAAGSVGCCSDYGEPENLDFLNTLGPKFKTLADVCRKT
ncbi:hypothetical protein INR49_010704 [Caranx melampygus]|nr:hypothetical protein INR49_010704 [Caranx melampygus]